ncbi:alkaline phosphatase PhoX [Parasegetibacter sp. NRK P23]|uniref:alkaline phosphatase PhoX n=1 Tax=Parasegetibacter sp. NRK P23 TaxID=2942999 RepID=UPI002043260F|nr:alkaline phosphatase PhoX [Parasegetibacter sp. NRK P23]MCM5529936.1 PhoX family protein [Parasegetibacter sp. NRK P23]
MKKLLPALTLPLFLLSCDKNDKNGSDAEKPEFRNRSNAESFVTIDPAFSSTVSAYTLISTSDTIPGYPNFIYGGAPDGQGFLKNPDGTGYIMVTNHENTYAVSRVYLDKKLNPVKGEYIVNTDGGMFRLCSGSLATPEEHGFSKPTFLTTGESNVNAMTHAIDPIATANPSDQSRVKPALGKFSGENSVPLPKDAYPGKTVIILGEDAGNGQVYLYVSNTMGDLDNGKFYALRRTDLNQVETAMTKGNTYDVEFVEVPNAKNLTGAEIENLNSSLKSIQFARVEDLDYQKGGGAKGREVYFVATGVSGQPEKTYWGRVYHLTMNASDPLKGKLSIIEDGDLNPGKDIINPDNLCVTENYVYIQEDGDSFFPGASHNSLIWQHTISSGTKKVFLDLKNKTLGNTKYNPNNDQRYATWEHGAMIDISKNIDVPNTFLINIHAHTWVDGDKFLNPSKATSVQPYKAGGQTLILTGVPR